MAIDRDQTLRERILSRAESARAEGDLNGAKKALQGGIEHVRYDPAYYEALGKVHLDLGELEQAGKYLFLSSARLPEYREAVALFLRLHHNQIDFRQLYKSFPRRARKGKLALYPSNLQKELIDLGFPEEFA